MFCIGIDVGGTFTDLVAVDAQGRVTMAKSASTPGDQSLGVMEGLDRLAEALGLDRAAMLAQTERIVHGTTVATNALLEHKGAKVGLLTTEGHRDIIEMREGLKDDRYNLRQPPPEQLVPRERRLGVRERMRPDGRVEIALDRGSLDAAIAVLKRQGVEAVAICYLHSWRDGGHERATAEAVRAAMPGVYVCALLGGAAADQGVRSRLHDRRQRLRRAGAGALPDPARDAAARGGAARAGADHPVARRRRDHCRGRAAGSGRRALRPGRRRRRQPVRGAAAGSRQPHSLRHGRHLDRHLAGGRRRGGDRVGPPHRRPTRGAAEPGHRQHRRRRRLDRARRPQRRAARRTRERRRAAGPGLLRPRRRRGDGDGRQPRPRLPRSRQLSRRPMRASIAAPPRTLSIASPASSASTAWPRPRGSIASSTRTWPRASGSSPCAAASIRGASPSSRSAAQQRCM